MLFLRRDLHPPLQPVGHRHSCGFESHSSKTLIASGFIVIVLNNFQDQLVFYVTPSDALKKYKANPSKSKFRLGGLVLEGSVVHPASSPEMEFVVTDLITDILIRKGMLAWNGCHDCSNLLETHLQCRLDAFDNHAVSFFCSPTRRSNNSSMRFWKQDTRRFGSTHLVQVRRVQKYIETLDMLKVKNSKLEVKRPFVPIHQKHQIPIPVPNNVEQQRNAACHVPRKSTVTTNWESFDSSAPSSEEFKYRYSYNNSPAQFAYGKPAEFVWSKN